MENKNDSDTNTHDTMYYSSDLSSVNKPPADKTGVNKIAKGFLIALACLCFLIGPLLLFFDGYCAGGAFCTKPPQFLALLGAFLFSVAVWLVAFCGRKYRSDPLRIYIIPIITVSAFLIRLIMYYVYKG